MEIVSEACVVDRISDLPNAIIAHILNFLETKEVFATSVLSTRWKLAWTLVPRLCFGDRDFGSKECFISFIDRLLSLDNNLCFLRDLELNGSQNYDVSCVATWVSAALKCKNLERFDFGISNEDAAEDEKVVFLDPVPGHKLKALILDSDFVVDIPTSFLLPSLKIFKVDYLEFPNANTIERLLRGCPMLEEFHIGTGMNHFLNISSPVLRRLYVDFSYRNQKIVVDAPALQYLKFTGRAPSQCVLNNLNQVMKAKFDCCRHIEMFTEMDAQALTDILYGVSQVQTLYLSSHVIEIVLVSGLKLPKFHNLTCLTLELTEKEGWRLIPDMLENSPSMEKLVLLNLVWADKSTYNIGEDLESWIAPRYVPSCLVNHLKHIKIVHVKVDEEQEKLVNYFLENGEVLEEIALSCFGLSKSRLVKLSYDGKGRRARMTSNKN